MDAWGYYWASGADAQTGVLCRCGCIIGGQGRMRKLMYYVGSGGDAQTDVGVGILLGVGVGCADR